MWNFASYFRLIKYKIKQEFKDPVSEGFKRYLSTSEGCEENNTENCNEFAERYVRIFMSRETEKSEETRLFYIMNSQVFLGRKTSKNRREIFQRTIKYSCFGRNRSLRKKDSLSSTFLFFR